MADPIHFSYPFAFSPTGTNALTVDQDTLDDIVDCVEAIVATELGFRPEHPSFGLPDQVFELQGLDLENLIQMIESQDPRIQMILNQAADKLDPLTDRVSAIAALRKAVDGTGGV